jgi:hypothetical protein
MTPNKDEVGPFEEFRGSHGGLGGPQMNPVAVVSTCWSEAAAPIVGDEDMHRMLRAWLAETGLLPEGAPTETTAATTAAPPAAGSSSYP